MTEQTPCIAIKDIQEQSNTKRERLQLLIALSIGKIVVLLSVFLYNPSINFLHLMSTRWDSIIFQNIATDGYTQISQYAFPPVYPALIHSLDFITGHSWVSGLVITNVISFIFPLVLHKTFGFKTTLLAILFPTYLVFTTIPYSDAIVLILLALSLFFMLREKFIASSGMISLAIIGSFHQAWLLPAYVFEIFNLKRLRNLTFCLLPLVTGILIFLWFKWKTGDVIAYFSIEEKSWGVYFASPYEQVLWLIKGWFAARTHTIFGINLPPIYWMLRNILFELFYLVGAVYLLWTTNKHREFLFLYSLFAIIPLLFVIGTPAISIPRLLLPAFPVFLSYATLLKKEWHYWIYGVVCLAVSAWISISQAYSFFA